MMRLKTLVILVLVGGNVFFVFAQEKGKKQRASADTSKQINAYDIKSSETIPDTSILDRCIIRLDEIDYTKEPE